MLTIKPGESGELHQEKNQILSQVSQLIEGDKSLRFYLEYILEAFQYMQTQTGPTESFYKRLEDAMKSKNFVEYDRFLINYYIEKIKKHTLIGYSEEDRAHVLETYYRDLENLEGVTNKETPGILTPTSILYPKKPDDFTTISNDKPFDYIKKLIDML